MAATALKTASIPRHYGDQFQAHLKQASTGMILAARVAGEVRRVYGHADYLAWAGKMGVGERGANRLLAVNRNILENPTLKAKLEDLPEALGRLSTSALYKLAEESTPDEVRGRVVEQASKGNPPTAKDVDDAREEGRKPERKPKPQRVEVKRREEDRRGDDDREEVGNAFPNRKREEKVEAWEEIALLVDETCEQLEEVARNLIAGFAVKNKEITHPYARQYSHHGTIGSLREFIRLLRDGKPVGEDDKGVITARAKALAESRSKGK